MRRPAASAALCALFAAGAVAGCVSRPPTIAHVHLGHAVTAVHVTPGHEGYVEVARQRAVEAAAALDSASRDAELPALKADVERALHAIDDKDNFGLTQSLTLAANHISFAATSADASDNVIRFAPEFKLDIAGVLGRCEYLLLLGRDVAATGSLQEAGALSREMRKAAQANVDGDDSTGLGKGRAPADYGMVQLMAQVQAMIARERPRYRTVDQWYLFNLVRLPNGRWVFDKLGRGGNIDGYK